MCTVYKYKNSPRGNSCYIEEYWYGTLKRTFFFSYTAYHGGSIPDFIENNQHYTVWEKTQLDLF